MGKWVAQDFSMKALRYHRIPSRWSGKIAEKDKARKLEGDAVETNLSKTQETKNIALMSRWRQCAKVSGLSYKGAEIGHVRDWLVAETIAYATNIAAGGEENKDSHSETLNVFPNFYSLRVCHEFLGYIADESEARLVEGTVSSLTKLDAWIITLVQCFAEQEVRGRHRQKL